MKDSKLNIKFNYLYRDASNYKQYGSVIFSNLNNLSILEIDDIIRNRLIEKLYFNHTEFGIPSLFFENKNDDDHDWHEYENIEITNEISTDKRTIEEFLKQLESIINLE